MNQHLSDIEKSIIIKNVKKLSKDDIAKKLQRSIQTVARFIKKKNLVSCDRPVHCERKIGTVVIRNRNGKRKYIKVGQRNWILLSRYNWIQAYGPIPPGFEVNFKTIDTLNCEVDNLMLVNRKEKGANLPMTDQGIAVILCTGQYDLYPLILNDKRLIELKRQQLILNRLIYATGKERRRANREARR